MGFENLVGVIYLLFVVSALIFAFVSIASEFPPLDPLSSLFVVLVPVAMIVGVFFIEQNKNVILGGRQP